MKNFAYIYVIVGSFLGGLALSSKFNSNVLPYILLGCLFLSGGIGLFLYELIDVLEKIRKELSKKNEEP